MPGDRLDAHVATQPADHVAEAMRKVTPFVDEFTVLHTALVLRDKHLRQLNINDARVSVQRHVSDPPADIAVDGSLLAGDRVYGASAPVTTAVNDELLLLLIQRNLIDPLSFEAENILRDADAHIPVLYKVVRSLIFQQVTWESASFFTHRAREEPNRERGSSGSKPSFLR